MRETPADPRAIEIETLRDLLETSQRLLVQCLTAFVPPDDLASDEIAEHCRAIEAATGFPVVPEETDY